MNYIVLDLEWNQSIRPEEEVPGLPFEIIEIGAVRLDADLQKTGDFSRLIKPSVYRQMNRVIGDLVHLDMKDLEGAERFEKVGSDFLTWCEFPDSIFCVWGELDLTELQRNLEYFDLPELSDGPIAYLDVQKLFSLCFEDGKARRSLETAVDMLGLDKTIPFHRAYSDAFYTAELLRMILRQKPQLRERVSFDVYHPPADRDREVKIQFDSYMKYISRAFPTKQEAFADREVASSKCYLCHRNLRKKIRWFGWNGKHYYCLAYCEKHGYLKGKIRVKRAMGNEVYIVKTTKLISAQEAAEIKALSERAKELRKKHRQ